MVFQETLGELEHVGRREEGLAETVEDGLVAKAEAIAPDDFLCIRVPEDQLLVAVRRIGVIFVYVQLPAGASAVVSEGDFP